MRNYSKYLVLFVLSAIGAFAAAALPADYTSISTDAAATFAWAKEFKIGVIIFLFVVALVGLARSRK